MIFSKPLLSINIASFLTEGHGADHYTLASRLASILLALANLRCDCTQCDVSMKNFPSS